MSRTKCADCDVYAVAYLGEESAARYECPECGESWVERRELAA